MGILSKLFNNNQSFNNINQEEITSCSNCGAKINNNDANYCTICGYSVNKSNENTALICPECGLLYEDETTICPACNKLLAPLDKDHLYDDFMKEYAITLVLWGYDKPKKLINNNSMPVYYTYECKISDIELLQKEMIEDRLLKHPNDVEMLQILKIDQLKEILKENKLPVSGKKEELIERIVNDKNVDIKTYNNSGDYYMISDIGERFLDRNNDYIELHRSSKYRISTREYYETKKRLLERYKTCNFRDCVWAIFQQRLLGYSNKNDYFWLYWNYENMADFTYNKGKTDIAVRFYLICVIYELCGVSFYNEYKWFKNDLAAEDMLVEAIENGHLYDNNITHLIRCKDYFSKDMIKREYDHLEMNFKLCSLEFIEQIIEEAMRDSMFNISDYKELIKRERLNNLKRYI